MAAASSSMSSSGATETITLTPFEIASRASMPSISSNGIGSHTNSTSRRDARSNMSRHDDHKNGANDGVNLSSALLSDDIDAIDASFARLQLAHINDSLFTVQPSSPSPSPPSSSATANDSGPTKYNDNDDHIDEDFRGFASQPHRSATPVVPSSSSSSTSNGASVDSNKRARPTMDEWQPDWAMSANAEMEDQWYQLQQMMQRKYESDPTTDNNTNGSPSVNDIVTDGSIEAIPSLQPWWNNINDTTTTSSSRVQLLFMLNGQLFPVIINYLSFSDRISMHQLCRFSHQRLTWWLRLASGHAATNGITTASSLLPPLPISPYDTGFATRSSYDDTTKPITSSISPSLLALMTSTNTITGSNHESKSAEPPTISLSSQSSTLPASASSSSNGSHQRLVQHRNDPWAIPILSSNITLAATAPHQQQHDVGDRDHVTVDESDDNENDVKRSSPRVSSSPSTSSTSRRKRPLSSVEISRATQKTSSEVGSSNDGNLRSQSPLSPMISSTIIRVGEDNHVRAMASAAIVTGSFTDAIDSNDFPDHELEHQLYANFDDNNTMMPAWDPLDNDDSKR
jgi:hypothetical protein